MLSSFSLFFFPPTLLNWQKLKSSGVILACKLLLFLGSQEKHCWTLCHYELCKCWWSLLHSYISKISWREGFFLDTSLKYWPAFFPAAPDQSMMAPDMLGTTTRDLKSMRIRLKDKSFTRVALVKGRRESCSWKIWLGHTLSVKEQYKCMVWLHMVPLQNEGLCGYCTIVFICVGNICCNFSYGLLKKVQCQILRSFSDKNSLMFSNKAMWVRKGCLDWKS